MTRADELPARITSADPQVGQQYSAASRWLWSWRLCLRLAVRDLREARWRTVLGITTIALPLLIIAAVGVFVMSQQPAASAMVSADMGAGQALLRQGSPDGATFPSVWYAQDGIYPGSTGQFRRAEAEEVTGGRLLPTGSEQIVARSGGILISGRSVRVGTDPGYAGMVTLTSGRWPQNANEALLGGLGQAAGIPQGARVDVVDQATGTVHVVRSVRIVGTVRSTDPLALVELPDERTATSWILIRQKPVGAVEASDLSRYGVSVAVRDQVATSSVSPGGDQGVVAVVVSMLTVGIVVVIAALVAPVFAVGASRSRRAVALLAGNGATTAQRRRYVLSQAMIVGVAAAILAPILGAMMGAVSLLVYRQRNPASWAGPVIVPWPWGLLMAVVAVAASLAAALAPAVAASRRPVVSSLVVHPAPRHRGGLAIAGLLIAGVCAVLVWRGVRDALQGVMQSPTGAAIPLTVGGIGLFVGALMVVPWLLVRMGAMSASFPAAPRLAWRDLARQRTRGTAVIGSVVATVGVMVAVLIPLTSQRASQTYTYQPAVAPGDLLVSTPGTYDGSPIRTAAAATLPGSRVIPLSTARPGGNGRILLLPAAGCEKNAASWSSLSTEPCRPALSTGEVNVEVGVGSIGEKLDVATGSPEDLASLYRLTAQQRSVLQAGGMVLSPGVAEAAGLAGPSGTVTAESAVVTHPATRYPQVAKVETLQVPYILATRPLAIPPLNPHAVEIGVVPALGALTSDSTATALGAFTQTGEFLVRRDGGLDQGDADQLQARLAASGYSVEGSGSPFRTPDLRLPVLAVGGVLILIAIGSGIVLAQSDRRREDEVFLRLGAGRGLRRRVNAWWAATATFVGVVVGLLAGWVPGTAMAVEARSWAEVYAAPWGTVAALLLGAPVVAAGLAALITRGAPADAGFRRRPQTLR